MTRTRGPVSERALTPARRTQTATESGKTSPPAGRRLGEPRYAEMNDFGKQAHLKTPSAETQPEVSDERFLGHRSALQYDTVERPTAEQMRAEVRALVAAGAAPFRGRIQAGGANVPLPELEPVMARLSATLESPVVQRQIQGDAALRALHTQLATSISHVTFRFDVEHDDYPHAKALLGPCPAEPTLEVLRKADELFRIMAARGADVSGAPPYDSGRARALIAQQEKWVRSIVASPVEAYRDMRLRLENEGPTASFPEFAPVVEHLKQKLQSDPSVRTEAAANPHLEQFRQVALERLNEVEQGLPYRATVLAILRSLEFFEVHQRAKMPEAPPLYHAARYEYYQHYLLDQIPDHVFLPTLVPLKVSELLATRGVPIGFAGVNTTVEHVDGFPQTSAEFWYHDVNHDRRMFQFAQEHAERTGTPPHQAAEQATKLMKEKLLPMVESHDGDTAAQAAARRLLRMMLFEVLHEDALPADASRIIEAVHRPANERTPFERIENDKVVYFMEPGATTLAYVFRKLTHTFYNPPGTQREAVTREEIVEQATKLLEAVGASDVSRERLIALVSTDEGFPDAFRAELEKDIGALGGPALNEIDKRGPGR